MSDAEDQDRALEDVLGALGHLASESLRTDEAYQALVRLDTVQQVLRRAEHLMLHVVLQTTEVLRQKHGMKVNEAQYRMLQGLPERWKAIEREEHEQRGWQLSVDRTVVRFAREFMEAGDDAEAGR